MNIISIPDAVARTKEVALLLEKQNLNSISELISGLMDNAVLLNVSKPLLAQMQKFAEDVKNEFEVQVLKAIADKTSTRSSRFGEVSVAARENLVDYFEVNNYSKDALYLLLTIPLEIGLKSDTSLYRVSLFTRATRLCLDLDDIGRAETFIGKARDAMKGLASDTSDVALQVKKEFSLQFAIVLDLSRKFIDAAQRYFDLSMNHPQFDKLLQKSIVCVVLADAGPQRSRLLAALFKDERVASLGDISAVLSKVFHMRVLRKSDVDLLTPFLQDHQKAVMHTGRTVDQTAVMQHNLQAAAHVYYNISIEELGVLLQVPADEAELVAAQMISENRLVATIDQEAQIIEFHADATAAIHQWDYQISSACNSVSTLSDAILHQHPSLSQTVS